MKKTIIFVTVTMMSIVMLVGCGSHEKKLDTKNKKFNVNVHVTDEDKNPISGVKVQACDDSVCKVADTDSDGVAGFSMGQNVVDIHILKAPEGFKVDSKEVFKTDENGELSIELKR